MTGIIAVHVGAGCHSSSLKNEYKKLMKKSCKEAISILNNKGSAIDAVCCATQILENSSITNAGYGSSLTADGTVECDASVMDGRSLRNGAVGAVPGVRNPVLLAREILEAQQHPLPGGLIPPSFLTGSGARSWAVSHDVEICSGQELITDKSKKIQEESLKYIRRLEERKGKRRRCNSQEDEELQSGLLDTVGAVCVDLDGNVASAVSSGGLLLKHSGRVGQAAVYGCGCWAENNCDRSGINIAVSTSGCGEHLIRTMFARLCARSTLLTDPLGTSLSGDINKDFLESGFLEGVDSRMAGSLSLRYNPSASTTDLFWLHTTRTMGIAYMSVSCQNAQALFSELPLDRVGLTVTLNCKSFGENSSTGAVPGNQEEEADDHKKDQGQSTSPVEKD